MKILLIIKNIAHITWDRIFNPNKFLAVTGLIEVVNDLIIEAGDSAYYFVPQKWCYDYTDIAERLRYMRGNILLIFGDPKEDVDIKWDVYVKFTKHFEQAYLHHCVATFPITVSKKMSNTDSIAIPYRIAEPLRVLVTKCY